MKWIEDVQTAIDFVEQNLNSELDYAEIAAKAHYSSYHFQRLFGFTCGLTLGEYIRKRRLFEAGRELLSGDKVIDVAVRYAYETPESFSRAFRKFHGVLPSKVQSERDLKPFPRLTLRADFTEKSQIEYSVEELPELLLLGYKKRFTGVPYGEERARQEEAFFKSTRAKQWLLCGASSNYENDYCVVDAVADDGYDFFVAYEVDEWTKTEFFNPKITGVDFIDKLGVEPIVIPKRTYAVFKTAKAKNPTGEYADIRKKIVTEWLPNSGFVLADAPEVVCIRWRVKQKKEWAQNRYIEIRLPIEKKTVLP